MQVGTRGMRIYCTSFCNSWHAACASAYVAVSGSAGELHWCTEGSDDVLCSQLADLAPDGAALCRLAGTP
jgi:hypothetical protein